MLKKIQMNETQEKLLASSLSKADFFANLSIAEVDKLLPYIQLYDYPSGAKIFKKGDPGDALYIVCEGTVSVMIKEGLFKKDSASLGPGDFFGEMALLENKPRSATVMTEKGAKIFILLADDFKSVLAHNPSFDQVMQRLAARRKFETTH